MSIDELGGQSRRDFIRKAAVTGAFVVPAVTSFGMKVSGAANRSGSLGVGASNVGGSNLDPGSSNLDPGSSNLDPGASNVTTTTTIASNVTTTTVASNVTTTTVAAATTTTVAEEVTTEETGEDNVLAAETLPESK